MDVTKIQAVLIAEATRWYQGLVINSITLCGGKTKGPGSVSEKPAFKMEHITSCRAKLATVEVKANKA